MFDMMQHCGFVSIVGRPNTGKSTLLNKLVGQKISITARKPQTTRTRITGIKSTRDSQVIYVDTPGLQKELTTGLGRCMNRELGIALSDIDLILHVIDSGKWQDLDLKIYEKIRELPVKKFLVINKIDRISEKQNLLPAIKKITGEHPYDEIFMVSAKTGKNIKLLENAIVQNLPSGQAFFPAEQVTDRNKKFLSAEFIREKLTRLLGDEIPYSLLVTIDKFEELPGITHIFATIWVETQGQKKIVVGKDGSVLKKVGEQARHDLELMLDTKVNIKTWVKTRKKWMDDVEMLKNIGFDL